MSAHETAVEGGCRADGDSTGRLQRRTLTVLSLAQVVGGIGSGAGLTMASLLIREVSGSTRWAGLAVVMVTLGASAVSIPLARLAGARGRRPSLALGWALGAAGAACSVAGAMTAVLPLLLLGLGLFGASVAANLQSRFAAVDLAPPHQVGRSMSLVTWSTAAGAVAGPNVAGPASEVARALSIPDAAGSMVFSTVAFALAGLINAVALRPDPLVAAGGTRAPGRRRSSPRIRRRMAVPSRVGLITVCAAQGTTGLVMAVSPIQMQDNGWSFGTIGMIMSIHFAGMYGLAPVMGVLTDRIGAARTVVVGQALVAASLAVSATAGAGLPAFVLGLLLLGLGWSATSNAGSALLVRDVPAPDRPGLQGLGDMAMTFASAAFAFLSGFLFAAFGFPTVNIAAGVLVAVVLVSLPALRAVRAAGAAGAVTSTGTTPP
ncbi:MFS transporter [Streptomyces sp. NPDC004610]|uniref:MFS transporter n=1 Tax=unclassified Streptomyces TaxID=2593676 RepID=UPI0033B0CEF2